MNIRDEGRSILERLQINFKDVLSEDDAKRRFVSKEDKGLFFESTTNKTLLGKRGGQILQKMTTPGGSFPAIPTVKRRESVRVTKRNLARFRSRAVIEKENRLRSLFGKFDNARDASIARLRSLSPELFRTARDLDHERQTLYRKTGDKAFLANDLMEDELRLQRHREDRVGILERQIEGETDREIDAAQARAIGARQDERFFSLQDRDRIAAEGTSGTTPLTVRFGRGKAQIDEATGNKTILQGITPDILDAQNIENRTPTNVSRGSRTQGSSLSAKVRETRLSTARQRLKRVRDSSSET